MSNLIGRTIGKYKIESELGKGASGTTFLASHLDMSGTIVALKFFHGFIDHKVFEHEKTILAELSGHSNIIRILDTGLYDGSPYIVMDYKNGGSLRQYFDYLLNNPNSLDIGAIFSLFRRIASAIEFAHERNITHRDLKPENILLEIGPDNELIPFVTDFSVAKIQDASRYSTQGSLVGTYAYMAPEAWKPGIPKGTWGDIYAFGVMLYEVLEGHPPFKGQQHELMEQHINKPVPYPHRTQQLTNKHVAKVILKALKKGPKERFRSALDLMKALELAYLENRATVPEERLPWQRVAILIPVIGAIIACMGQVATPIIDSMFAGAEASIQTPTIAISEVSPSPTSTATPTLITNTPTPDASPEDPTCRITVNASRLNMRAGPGTEYDILRALTRGTEATVIGRNNNSDWWHINLQGVTGWVSTSYTDVAGICRDVAQVIAPPTPTSVPPTLTWTPLPPTLTSTPDLQQQYTGSWINNDPNTRGITRIQIWFSGNTPYMHWWGACTPSDCDNGTFPGLWQGSNLVYEFTSTIGHAQYVFTASINGNTLTLNTYTHFIDNSEREDQYNTYAFSK